MTIISFAQITTSSISGVVVNEKKEVMVGASVGNTRSNRYNLQNSY